MGGSQVVLQIQVVPSWAFAPLALGKAFAPAVLEKVPVDEVCWGTQQAWEDVHCQAERVEVGDLAREALPLVEVGLVVAVVLAFAPDCCQMRLGQRKEQQEGTDRECSDASWLLPQIKVRQAPKEEMSC